jgi:hypothetical protein
MANCCSKFILALLSLCSIGLVVTACAFVIYAYTAYDLNDVTDSPILGITIAALCISAFVLIFSMIASCSNSGCLGFILGIVFLVFAGILIAAFVLIIKDKDTIFNAIGKKWREASADFNETIGKIEEALNCSTWDNATTTSGKVNCESALKDKFKSFQIYILIGLGLAAVLLLIGAVLAFMKMCGSSEKYESFDRKANLVEQPLSYGW